MMATAVIDSNVLIAARVASDEYHAIGRRIATGIRDGDLPVGFVPHDVLTEVLNYVHSQASQRTALETLYGIVTSDRLELVETTDHDFREARPLFERYDSLSFTDAVLAAYARHENVPYVYSFDDNFDAIAWMTRLNSDVNPFGR